MRVKDGRLTLMYIDVPTNVFAMELMSSPETPKSQSLMSPSEFNRIFDGLMSEHKVRRWIRDVERKNTPR